MEYRSGSDLRHPLVIASACCGEQNEAWAELIGGSGTIDTLTILSDAADPSICRPYLSMRSHSLAATGGYRCHESHTAAETNVEVSSCRGRFLGGPVGARGPACATAAGVGMPATVPVPAGPPGQEAAASGQCWARLGLPVPVRRAPTAPGPPGFGSEGPRRRPAGAMPPGARPAGAMPPGARPAGPGRAACASPSGCSCSLPPAPRAPARATGPRAPAIEPTEDAHWQWPGPGEDPARDSDSDSRRRAAVRGPWVTGHPQCSAV